MKIYTLDLAYYGSVVVIEDSLSNAWKKMVSLHPGIEEKSINDIVEHEVNNTFVFVNYGDW